MPTLNPGEEYLCTDTFEMFVGTASGNQPTGLPVFNTLSARVAKAHIQTGTITIPAAGTINVLLAAGQTFTGSGSYVTVASAKHVVTVTQVSGTTITFAGTSGDLVSFICIGN